MARDVEFYAYQLLGPWDVKTEQPEKRLLSSFLKTPKKLERIEKIRDLLFEKYQNRASANFWDEAKQITGKGDRTIKRYLKKIRENIKGE